MIQTEYRDDRGELQTLTPGDEKYWHGPYRFEPYPMTLFKARLGQPPLTKIVRNDAEREAAGRDWKETPDEAAEVLNGYEAEMARVAAEENFRVSKMSEGAQAEYREADRATDEFIADVPVKRGRPRKSEVIS